MSAAHLPEPAPEVVMDLTGAYWRRYPDGNLSIPPSTTSNDPVIGPLAVYRLTDVEEHDGSHTPLTARVAYDEHVAQAHAQGRPHSDTACPSGLRAMCPFAAAAIAEAVGEYGGDAT